MYANLSGSIPEAICSSLTIELSYKWTHFNDLHEIWGWFVCFKRNRKFCQNRKFTWTEFMKISIFENFRVFSMNIWNRSQIWIGSIHIKLKQNKKIPFGYLANAGSWQFSKSNNGNFEHYPLGGSEDAARKCLKMEVSFFLFFCQWISGQVSRALQNGFGFL